MWSALYFGDLRDLDLDYAIVFFDIHVCYTLISNNVRGIFAKKTVSGDITTFLRFCIDLLPRGNRDSVGVKTAVTTNYPL